MTRLTDAIRSALRYLTVTDPGFLRLRNAATTVAALGLVMLILTGFGHPVSHAVPAVLLGSYVAIQAASGVSDHTQRERVVTTVFLSVPALAAVTLGAVLLRYGRVAGIAFVGVLFLAVWLRRWGPRGHASGMIMYIAYFYALVLHAGISELPSLYLGICTGVAVTIVVRVFLLPERPRREIRSLVRALRAQTRAGLDVVYRAETPDPTALQRILDRIGDTAMMIEDWLDRNDADECVGISNSELAKLVFEAQVSTEEALEVLDQAPTEVRHLAATERATAEFEAALRPGSSQFEATTIERSASTAAKTFDSSTEEGPAALLVDRAARAHAALSCVGREQPSPGRATREHAVAGTSRAIGNAGGVSASTRTAIQVAVAASIATVLGELVSPERWYWAVLTAFLVYNGASTRGEVLLRAGDRVIGTIGGVVIGMLLVAAVGNHPAALIALVLTTVFFAFYLVSVNYVAMTFFMTVMLAGLYGLLGEFSLDVLVVRIEETTVGAIVGIAAAYLVLAIDSRDVLTRAIDSYLTRLSDLIGDCMSATAAPDLIAKARALDSDLAAVTAAATPLVRDPMARGRRTVEWLDCRLREIDRAAHALVKSAVMTTQPASEVATDTRTREVLATTVCRVHDNIDLLRRRNAGERVTVPETPPESLADVLQSPPGDGAAALSVLPPLLRIDRTVVDLLA